MNQGFFQTEVVSQPKQERASCGGTCRLLRGCHSPKMPVTGQGRMKILVVAEAPGEQEDKRNTQLIGPAGQLLRDALAEFGVDLDRDCRKTNAVRCRPPENRAPTGPEIAACQSHLWDEIKERPPKLIMLLGQVAVESFLHGRTKAENIGRWRGFTVPDQKAGAWICPTFHPSYILRSREGRAIRGKAEPVLSVEERTFMADLENALTHLKTPFPSTPVPKFPDEWTVKKGDSIAVDYETTGLRPWQRKDHRIVSVGISNGDWAWAGAMTPDLARKWKLILQADGIHKVGHNIKFEHQWAAHFLGVETRGWVWDTMLAAHLLDNRRRICKLKHQTYLNFGVEDWSSGVDFGDDENEREQEKEFDAAPTEELLKYNALDAFWTYQLYKKQREQFS